MTEPQTHTLEVPGAVLAYDVRPGDGSSSEPPLFVFGSPMAASGFGTLAALFPERTVVTYDPRGAERSRRTDGAATSTPEEHADDLARVIEAVGGPVDALASSGGAVNALVLVSRRPELVRTLVAHEPPAVALLPDREEADAACRHVSETYQRAGYGAGMAEFIRLVTHEGPIPADWADHPADPAAFGLPPEDDGSRDDVLLGQNMASNPTFEHDLDALRRASTRIVPAVGAGSVGQLAHRGGEALADALGVPAVVFPGDHGSFLDTGMGEPVDAPAFAARLREVLGVGMMREAPVGG